MRILSYVLYFISGVVIMFFLPLPGFKPIASFDLKGDLLMVGFGLMIFLLAGFVANKATQNQIQLKRRGL
jgi:hypothetical protein